MITLINFYNFFSPCLCVLKSFWGYIVQLDLIAILKSFWRISMFVGFSMVWLFVLVPVLMLFFSLLFLLKCIDVVEQNFGISSLYSFAKIWVECRTSFGCISGEDQFRSFGAWENWNSIDDIARGLVFFVLMVKFKCCRYFPY